MVDFDEDGWSDIWESAYGRGYQPLLDDDGDGRTNQDEQNDGTDPKNASSVRPSPKVDNVGRFRIRFSWPTIIGKIYQLQVSFNGLEWSGLGIPVVGTGENVEHIIDTRQAYLGTGPLLDRYTGLSEEANLDGLKTSIASRAVPAESHLLDRAETPQTIPDLDYYGERLHGWLIAPENGAYVFSIAGDLITEFSLSTSSSPQRLVTLAHSEMATGFREWGKAPTQTSPPVILKRGGLYFFEALQKETTGSDHLSVAWTGPGLNPHSEVILGAYVTATADTFRKARAKGFPPTYRILVSDRDSDGDGLTDYEELTVGLDPNNPASVSHTSDLETLRTKLTATNVITVGAEKNRGNEAEQQPARFTFSRSGNINPLTVYFTVGGTAQSGLDFAPLRGVVEFAVGQTSASVDLLPEKDMLFESAETVTATLTPDVAYTLGASASATARIEDAADAIFVATLAPAGTKSVAYGTVALRISGNKAFGDFSLSFGNLTSSEISAEFFLLGPAQASTLVRTLPQGQIAAQRWVFDATGRFSAAHIFGALKSGRFGVRIKTTRFPTGEIDGLFVSNWGWKTVRIPPTPSPALTRARSDGEAARFLTQTTFGATPESIALVKRVGFGGWLNEQFRTPATLHLPYVRARREEILARTGGEDDGQASSRQEAWWQAALTAPDQLRQRMAFALSEIFVVSEQGSLIESYEGMANYYDLLLKHAFGNYRELLEDVTLSPIMGQYLSMVRNEKPNPVTGTEPDENYAREVHQLFTIGLNQLNTDGSMKLSAEGLPIVSYTQNDVVGLAHVFTGWGFAFDPANPPENLRSHFRFGGSDDIPPMIFYPEFHDMEAKEIVGNIKVPANLSGSAELKIALDTLFQHSNVGPFIAQRLIQRFVTGNPSRGYIYRVATVFNNNGDGVRGDLGATLRAVLLDPEARNPVFVRQVSYGKLREPVLRVSALLRAFPPAPPVAGDARFFINLIDSIPNQAPLKSPSVFNFFQPGYMQPGEIAASGLFSPEFQITSEVSVISFTNAIHKIIQKGIGTLEDVTVKLNFDPSVALLERVQNGTTVNEAALIDSLNVLLLGGQMSDGMAMSIRNAFATLPADFGSLREQQSARVRMAVYIIATSPEFSVQK